MTGSIELILANIAGPAAAVVVLVLVLYAIYNLTDKYLLSMNRKLGEIERQLDRIEDDVGDLDENDN